MTNPTLEDAKAQYLEYLEEPGGGGNSRRNARQCVDDWIDFCSSLGTDADRGTGRLDEPAETLVDVDELVMMEYASHLQRQVNRGEMKASTAWKYLDWVSGCLTHAVEWELTDSNPARSGRVRKQMPEKPDNNTREQQFWTIDQRKALVSEASERAHEASEEGGIPAVTAARDRALVHVLGYTGARGAEILLDPENPQRMGIRWGDVDPDGQVVHVHSKTGSGESKEARPLPDRVQTQLELLEKHVQPASADWPVFPSLTTRMLYRAGRLRILADSLGIADWQVRGLLLRTKEQASRAVDEGSVPSTAADLSHGAAAIVDRAVSEGSVPTKDHILRDLLEEHGAAERAEAILGEPTGQEAVLDALREHHLPPLALSPGSARKYVMKPLSEACAVTFDDEHGYATLHGARRLVGHQYRHNVGVESAADALGNTPEMVEQAYQESEVSELADVGEQLFDESDG